MYLEQIVLLPQEKDGGWAVDARAAGGRLDRAGAAQLRRRGRRLLRRAAGCLHGLRALLRPRQRRRSHNTGATRHVTLKRRIFFSSTPKSWRRRRRQLPWGARVLGF